MVAIVHGVGSVLQVYLTRDLHIGIAFVVFCLAASGIYLVNDSLDVEADRAHPTKRFRPIAAGVVPMRLAYALSVVLLTASILISFVATWQLAVVPAAWSKPCGHVSG